MKVEKITPTENQLHAACVHWLTICCSGVLWHHSPNGGKRHAIGQRDLKTHGTRAGWPDLQLLRLDGQQLFIELKRKGGKPTRRQLECHADLRAFKQRVEVIDSFDDFQRLVGAWVR